MGDPGAGRGRHHRRARRRAPHPPGRPHGHAGPRATCSASTSGPTTAWPGRRPALLERHRELLEGAGRRLPRGGRHRPAGRRWSSFARAEHATQLVLGASQRSRWTELTRGSVINNVIRAGRRHRRPRHLSTGRRRRAPRPAGRRRPAGVRSRRRRQLVAPSAWPSVGLPPLTAGARDRVGDAAPRPRRACSCYLAVVVGVAAIGGPGPGLVAAVAAVLLGELVLRPAVRHAHHRTRPATCYLAVFLGVGAASSAGWSSRPPAAGRDAPAARYEADALAAPWPAR